MNAIDYETTRGHYGRVHTFTLGGHWRLKLVPAQLFDEFTGTAVHHDGPYSATTAPIAGQESLLVCARDAPTRSAMDRDDGWRRRRSLARLVLPFLGPAAAAFANRVPLELLCRSYLDALDDGATPQDVLSVVTRNTQAGIERATLARLASGRLMAMPLPQHDAAHPEYSHIELFAALYAYQIDFVIRLLDTARKPVLHVVDLGCGAGHFMLTLMTVLKRLGLLSRVRLTGLDSDGAAMRCGAALMAEQSWEGTYVRFDLTNPHAADRLRHMSADVIVCNHLLEHLEGPLENRFLHDLALAADRALSISLPLDGAEVAALCAHRHTYARSDLAALARQLPVRCADAIEVDQAQPNAQAIGLVNFLRLELGRRLDRPLRVMPANARFKSPEILEDFMRPFDSRQFARARRAPSIGRVTDEAAFAAIGASPRQVRQLLVKAPGGPLLLPRAFAQLEEAVTLAYTHNARFNPDHERCYAYLNVFRGVADVGAYRGLSLSLHGDQMQALDRRHAFKPDWSYIVSSSLPTTLFEQAFDLSQAQHLWELGERVNLYEHFSRQAHDECRYASKNFEILLLSPYVVHAASPAQEPTPRVFMKLAFSTRRFFDNRELRQNDALPIDAWLHADTLGYNGGWLSHAHWNERFLAEDIVGACPGAY